MGVVHWSSELLLGLGWNKLNDQSHIMASAEDAAKKGELNDQLKEYIHSWREERAKEEEELKRLKEKQAKRKEIRVEQEKKLAQQKRAEEEKLRKEEAEKKEAEALEKKKAMEDAERKRQEMMAAQKEKGGKAPAQAMDARKEMSKSKEQVEEEMKISLSIRIKPIAFAEMDSDEVRSKANQLWNKAIKKGLDPESFTGAHPPPIHMFSKYERRTDTRTYGDRKKLYEGGAEVLRSEALEAAWKDKFAEWQKRPKARLPKWFGVRPGKKEGDPDTPEGEEDAAAEEAAEEEEEYDEEEEEEEEEEE